MTEPRRSTWIPRSTPVPNLILDQLLPKLRDTELRVLLVIVRSTLGWVDRYTGNRKERERISSHQFKTRTGRESAAISKALEELSKVGLIVITTERGVALRTPFERRRARTKLFYSLHPDLLKSLYQPKFGK